MRTKLINLLSRKFLLSLIPAVISVVSLFITNDTALTLIGLIASAVVGIVFNIVEGKLDAKSIEANIDQVIEILKRIGVIHKESTTELETAPTCMPAPEDRETK